MRDGRRLIIASALMLGVLVALGVVTRERGQGAPAVATPPVTPATVAPAFPARVPAPAPAPVSAAPASPVTVGGASEPKVVYDEDGAHPVIEFDTHGDPEIEPQARRARQERALQLLDEALARMEAKLARAEQDGDGAAAQTARMRLQRLKAVRKLRADELAAAPK